MYVERAACFHRTCVTSGVYNKAVFFSGTMSRGQRVRSRSVRGHSSRSRERSPMTCSDITQEVHNFHDICVNGRGSEGRVSIINSTHIIALPSTLGLKVAVGVTCTHTMLHVYKRHTTGEGGDLRAPSLVKVNMEMCLKVVKDVSCAEMTLCMSRHYLKRYIYQ